MSAAAAIASPVRSPARSASPSTTGTRSDPRPRTRRTGFELVNADPDCHYVWAYKGDQTTGVEYYLQIGYEPVKWSEKGARPAGTRGTNGQDIERMGHLLMSIAQSERDDIEQHGITGDGGLEMVNARSARITGKQGNLLTGIPGIRGADGGAVLSVTNKTSAIGSDEVEE